MTINIGMARLLISIYVEETANFNTPIDNNLINQGNAFRTKEDAQKWLDFMKSMME